MWGKNFEDGRKLKNCSKESFPLKVLLGILKEIQAVKGKLFYKTEVYVFEMPLFLSNNVCIYKKVMAPRIKGDKITLERELLGSFIIFL